jgi:hypothetical protein
MTMIYRNLKRLVSFAAQGRSFVPYNDCSITTIVFVPDAPDVYDPAAWIQVRAGVMKPGVVFTRDYSLCVEGPLAAFVHGFQIYEKGSILLAKSDEVVIVEPEGPRVPGMWIFYGARLDEVRT